MYQVDNPTARATLPAPTAFGTAGYFSNGNPLTGEPATIIEAEFLNMVMVELLNLLAAAGITPDKSKRNQVSNAVLQIAAAAAAGTQHISWGSLIGSLADQTDLALALSGKSDVGHTHAFGVADISGLTTALSPGSSFGTSGYQQLPKLPGQDRSLIIQWGVDATMRFTGQSPTINFPIAFPHACYSAFPVPMNTDASDARDTHLQMVSVNPNAFTYFVNLTPAQYGGSVDGIQGAYWMALGS